MREYLFRGWSGYYNRWVCGSLIHQDDYCCILHTDVHPIDEPYLDPLTGCFDGHATSVIPESVGQYTDTNEFVVTDKSYNKPLFEGDIVEVWSRRRLPTEYTYSPPSSQYDIEVKARAVICFKYGKWFLDYNNNYNKALCKLRGNEQMERTVNASNNLYDFQYRGNEEWYREYNSHCKWSDIVKIGNTFENADLLEE